MVTSAVVGGDSAGRPCPRECECCQETWMAALTLAENVLLDEVYDRVQLRSPSDAVHECVLALRKLRDWRLVG